MRAEPGVELKVSTRHTCCLSFEMGAFKLSLLCWGPAGFPNDGIADLAHGAIMFTDALRTRAVGNRNPPARSPKAICSRLSTDSAPGLLAALADVRDWACSPPPPPTLQMLAVKGNSRKEHPSLVPTVLPNTSYMNNNTNDSNNSSYLVLHVPLR